MDTSGARLGKAQEAILHDVPMFLTLSVQACLNSSQPWKLELKK